MWCLRKPVKTIPITYYLGLIFLALMFNSCGKEASQNHTIFEGKLPAGTKYAQVNYGKDWEQLSVSKEGTFVDTLNIKDHQYAQLSFGDFETRFYITRGDKVNVSIDSDVSFSGSNAAINNYLHNEYKDNQDLGALEFNSHEKIFSKNESDYIHFRDSIRDAKINRLESFSGSTKPFQNFHRKSIEFQHQYDVARYPNYHSYYFKDYQPTSLIKEYLNEVPLDNETYAVNYPGYLYLVDLVLNKKIEDLNDKDLSPLEANLLVVKDIQSPTILHSRLSNALFHFTVNETNMELMRDKMLALAKQERTKKAIIEHYEIISKLKPGSPAPSFNFENYHGGKTNLSDLKGKYIYIDVWATWCAPCIREIPYLKKIEEEFSDANIEFVSISVDEPRFHGTWRKMIKTNELSGTQLLADDGWNSDFVHDYGIQGIPRFILIDDINNIISADIEKPSDPSLKEKLKALGL